MEAHVVADLNQDGANSRGEAAQAGLAEILLWSVR